MFRAVLGFLVFGLVHAEVLPFFRQVVVSWDRQPVRAVAPSKWGYFYYSTRLGLYRYDGKQHRRLVQKPYITALVEAPNGTLFFSTLYSLYQVDSTGTIIPVSYGKPVEQPFYDAVLWKDYVVFITDETFVLVPFSQPEKAKKVLLPGVHAGYGVVKDRFYVNIVGIGLHVLDEQGSPLALANGEFYERIPILALFPGPNSKGIAILRADGTVSQFPQNTPIATLPVPLKNEPYLKSDWVGDTLYLLTEKALYLFSKEMKLIRKIPMHGEDFYRVGNDQLLVVNRERMYLFSPRIRGMTITDLRIEPKRLHFLRLHGDACYIGTSGGLFQLNLRSGQSKILLQNQHVTAIQFEQDKVYVCSNAGIWELRSEGEFRRVFALPTLQFQIRADTLAVQLIDGVYLFHPFPPSGPPYKPLSVDPQTLFFYTNVLKESPFFPSFEVGPDGFLFEQDSLLFFFQWADTSFSWLSIHEAEKLLNPYFLPEENRWGLRNLILGNYVQFQESDSASYMLRFASLKRTVSIPRETKAESQAEQTTSLYLLLFFLLGVVVGGVIGYSLSFLKRKRWN